MSRSEIRNQLGDVNPNEVAAYLEAKGWVREQDKSELTSLWHRPSDEESARSAEVLLPISQRLKDYEDRLIDALAALASYERRPPLDILRLISQYFSDSYSVRVHHDDVAEGTIPLNDGIMLNERARELISASAMAAHKKRRHFVGKRTPEARDFLNTLRLGQTEVGSYVINVIAPIAYSELPQQAMQTTSLTRVVTSTLQSSLDALRQALSDYDRTNDASVFEPGVQRGVSANLCDALVGFSGTSRTRGFQITITPAMSDPLRQESNTYAFSPTEIDRIAFASDYYKEDYVVPDVMIQGFVKRLDRLHGETEGTVTVEATIRGMDKHVTIVLKADDYREAIAAHDAEDVVECSGNVHIKARTAKMLNPTNFRVLRSGELFLPS